MFCLRDERLRTSHVALAGAFNDDEEDVSWIKAIDLAEASGGLAEVYGRIASARSGVAEIHRVQSLNPRALAAHFELYKAIMFQPSPLSRAQREALAVAVSEANGCEYCVAHHSAALAQLPAAPLQPRLLAWAERLARTPESSSVQNIQELRSLGLDDRSILDGVLVVAYFSFVNRVALALGLTLEAGFERTCGSGLGA